VFLDEKITVLCKSPAHAFAAGYVHTKCKILDTDHTGWTLMNDESFLYGKCTVSGRSATTELGIRMTGIFHGSNQEWGQWRDYQQPYGGGLIPNREEYMLYDWREIAKPNRSALETLQCATIASFAMNPLLVVAASSMEALTLNHRRRAPFPALELRREAYRQWGKQRMISVTLRQEALYQFENGIGIFGQAPEQMRDSAWEEVESRELSDVFNLSTPSVSSSELGAVGFLPVDEAADLHLPGSSSDAGESHASSSYGGPDFGPCLVTSGGLIFIEQRVGNLSAGLRPRAPMANRCWFCQMNISYDENPHYAFEPLELPHLAADCLILNSFESAEEGDPEEGLVTIYVGLGRGDNGGDWRRLRKSERWHCVYPLCEDKHSHLIGACPTLRTVCSLCDRRGHDGEACGGVHDGELEKLYNTFAPMCPVLDLNNMWWKFDTFRPQLNALDLVHVGDFSAWVTEYQKTMLMRLPTSMGERALQALLEGNNNMV
jgi:hypothetical protein